jgi:hypothetical protein
MDFILPEYSLDTLRNAMETGTFFSIARYAKNELGEDFKGEGPVPQVISLNVDEADQTITIGADNCHTIEWIADGVIIQRDQLDADGQLVSTINLSDYTDKISCYVRAQMLGLGGICLTQAFILDDGNIERFKKEIVKKELTEAEKKKRKCAKVIRLQFIYNAMACAYALLYLPL